MMREANLEKNMNNLKRIFIAAIPLMLSGDLLAENPNLITLGDTAWVEVVESDYHDDTCIMVPGDSLFVLASEGGSTLAKVDRADGFGTGCAPGDTILVSTRWLDSQPVKYQQYKEASESKADLIERLRQKSKEANR